MFELELAFELNEELFEAAPEPPLNPRFLLVMTHHDERKGKNKVRTEQK